MDDPPSHVAGRASVEEVGQMAQERLRAFVWNGVAAFGNDVAGHVVGDWHQLAVQRVADHISAQRQGGDLQATPRGLLDQRRASTPEKAATYSSRASGRIPRCSYV
jgi:hypothetical protein